jgi:hypothetical protein
MDVAGAIAAAGEEGGEQADGGSVTRVGIMAGGVRSVA